MHFELALELSSASLMLVSSSNSNTHLPATHYTTELTMMHTPDAKRLAAQGNKSDGPLAVCLELLPKSSASSSSSPWSGGSGVWSGGKHVRKPGASGVSLKCVGRRHGFDVSASVAALTLHAGHPPSVKYRHDNTLLLSTQPAVVARMVQQGAGGDAHDDCAIQGRLEEVDAVTLLQGHLSIYDPQHVPVGRAPRALSLQLGCLGLNVDLDIAHQLVERSQHLATLLEPLASGNPDARPPLQHSQGINTPQALESDVPVRVLDAHGMEGGALRHKATANSLDSMLDALQVHASVALVTAGVGYRSNTTAAESVGGHAHVLQDWVRTTGRGGFMLWNCVSQAATSRDCGLLTLDDLSCHAVSRTVQGSVTRGSVTRVLARQLPHRFDAAQDMAQVDARILAPPPSVPSLLSFKVCQTVCRQARPCDASGSLHLDLEAWPDLVADVASSQFLLHVYRCVCQEALGGMGQAGTGMVQIRRVVRNYRLLPRCISGHSLVTMLVLAKLAADRLHAVTMVLQVCGLCACPCALCLYASPCALCLASPCALCFSPTVAMLLCM